MIDYTNFKAFESKQSKGTGTAALYVTKTETGIRIRFNSQLAIRLGIDASYIESGKGIQVLHDDEKIYLGKRITSDATSFKIKGSEKRPTMYNSSVGNAMIKMSGQELALDKTRCFYGITFDLSETGECVAIVDPKKF